MTADAFFRDPGRVYRPGKQCCPSPARASVHLLIELIEVCLYLLIIVGIMFVVALVEHGQDRLPISKIWWVGFNVRFYCFQISFQGNTSQKFWVMLPWKRVNYK